MEDKNAMDNKTKGIVSQRIRKARQMLRLADEMSSSYVAPDPEGALIQIKEAARQAHEAEAIIERHAAGAGAKEGID